MQLGNGAELTTRSCAVGNTSSGLFSFLSLNILLPSICFFFPLSRSAKKGDYYMVGIVQLLETTLKKWPSGDLCNCWCFLRAKLVPLRSSFFHHILVHVDTELLPCKWDPNIGMLRQSLVNIKASVHSKAAEVVAGTGLSIKTLQCMKGTIISRLFLVAVISK